MSNVTVRWNGENLGFVANDRGVINAVPFFDTDEFKDLAKSTWEIPTDELDVRAFLLHHMAGWYGPALGRKATLEEEFALLVALARDHRERFGIGPGYNMVAFHSGRVWAVGRHGTHRAHTKGRDPETMRNWNEVGRALVVPGDLNVEGMTVGLAQAINRGIADMRTWRGVRADVVIHEHGLTPTVNSAGVKFSQATECPGRNLSAWRAAGGLRPGGMESYEPDATGVAYTKGYRSGYGKGASDAAREFEAAGERVLGLVANPKAPASVPPPAAFKGAA